MSGTTVNHQNLVKECMHALAVGDYTQSARYVSVRHAMHRIAIREVKYSGNKLLWPIKSYVLYNRYFMEQAFHSVEL